MGEGRGGRERGKSVCVYREAEGAATSNGQHECMRGALGNDIGIMAGHGTNEMTNGPTDWNRGPGPGIGAPSKEGHGGNYTSKQGAVPPRL